MKFLNLPTTLVVRSDDEAAAALQEAGEFFLFVLESVAMMQPHAIPSGFLQEFDVELSGLVIRHDLPQS